MQSTYFLEVSQLIRILHDLNMPCSTHALAREARFSFLLFGFETLKSSYLDSYCENALRDAIYTVAYSWFSVRPQYVVFGLFVSLIMTVAQMVIWSEPCATRCRHKSCF